MRCTDVQVKKKPLSPKEMLPGVFAFAPNPDSFGGISYVVKNDGNPFMTDVPEYLESTLLFIEGFGMPEFIFLTHRDDVADAEKFRERFGSKLIIHQTERRAVNQPDVTFEDFLEIGDVMIIHTPGHSPGSSSLYYPRSSVMFTGDHITADGGGPVAEDFYWTYNYQSQLRSARKLLGYDFKYILPGHGGKRLIANAKESLKEFLESAWVR